MYCACVLMTSSYRMNAIKPFRHSTLCHSAQVAKLRNGADILVATCGRLNHFVSKGIVALSNLRYLCLDEGDQIVRDSDSSKTAALVKSSAVGGDLRVYMFSATFEEELQKIAIDFMSDPATLVIGDVSRSQGRCVSNTLTY